MSDMSCYKMAVAAMEKYGLMPSLNYVHVCQAQCVFIQVLRRSFTGLSHSTLSSTTLMVAWNDIPPFKGFNLLYRLVFW